MSLKQKIVGFLLSIVAILGGGYAVQDLGGAGGLGANSCTASSSAVTLGHQRVIQILPARANRAWVRLLQPVNATNTVYVSYGGTASVSSDYLTTATATSPVVSDLSGLNTDFPFVGAVTALTSTGSSTIRVTECIYN